MNRTIRTAVVLGVALLMAGGSTYLVYRTITQMPVREVEVARAFAVVAARALPLGTRIVTEDVRQIPWPAEHPVAGGFATVEEVLNRGIIAPVVENEPLTANNLATLDAGAGLPPTITPGMRAISVRVNEVIGVAGFVVPGTRVDVLAILNQAEGSVARVVVSNIQVLTAGTRYDQAEAKEGVAIPSTVVTLLVTPPDAERIALASSEGQILLTLRNPLDVEITNSPGTRAANLAGEPEVKLVAPRPVPVVARVRAVEAPAVVAAPPPPPPPYTVEVIRGAKRTSEPVKDVKDPSMEPRH